MFSCPSFFNVEWRRAASFSRCVFIDDNYGPITVNHPPVVIAGLPQMITIFGGAVRIGHQTFDCHSLKDMGRGHMQSAFGHDTADYLYPVLNAKDSLIGVKNTLQDRASVL